MNLNLNPLKVSASAIALLLMAGINNAAFADNTSALKDAIKTDSRVAEAKSTDLKATELPTDDNFKALDANKDGKVSLKEAVKDKALSAQFDVADINHDGMVSAEEYASYKVATSAPSHEATPAPTAN